MPRWPSSFLPRLGEALRSHGVEIRGDQRTRQLIGAAVAATEADYYAEYLGPQISVRVVDTLDGGDRSHQSLRLAPYGCDCHAEIWWQPGGLRRQSTVRR